MEVQWEAIRVANDERPDLVVLTGDFVGYDLDWLDKLQELVAGIQAPTIATLGNHDHWTDAVEVERTLRKAGADVLSNAWTELELSGQRLQVVGLDDAYTGHADVERATRGIDTSVSTLGLSHIPEEADALWQSGVPLVLSGHTHAGQLTFGTAQRFNFASMVGHRYVHGLYGDRGGEGALYVSAGVGSSTFGLRLGERARSEVAIFELGAEVGAFHEHHTEQAAVLTLEESARRRAKWKARAERRAAKKHAADSP
ncbi:MAG: putative MPP superfamily phosphohydrolase [Bradymonadia bacterium]|jgi:predicted MPP superfamily phosphohydrolase